MNHHKRIVLDFDDTLAFNKNRDWDNAEPNMELIEKTNKLYDEGWQIDIFTARGSISCETREEAKLKYEPGMIAWLQKHAVKYHSISFNKPLAAYYVDDKGISPDAFIYTDIRKLEGGLSGSDIYTDGEFVHKQDKNAHLVREWYAKAVGINTPKIDRIVGDTITMQYIEHNKNYFNDNIYMALGMIQTALTDMKSIPVPDDLEYMSYVKRIEEHANNSGRITMQMNANVIRSYAFKRSFSHGDFGITNMLFTSTKSLYLIDPIPNVFGCTEIDAAKFIASLYINKYDKEKIDICKRSICAFLPIRVSMLNALTAAEITRIYKYHPDKRFVMECFNEVFGIDNVFE